jgi:hypothetical protein
MLLSQKRMSSLRGTGPRFATNARQIASSKSLAAAIQRSRLIILMQVGKKEPLGTKTIPVLVNATHGGIGLSHLVAFS